MITLKGNTRGHVVLVFSDGTRPYLGKVTTGTNRTGLAPPRSPHVNTQNPKYSTNFETFKEILIRIKIDRFFELNPNAVEVLRNFGLFRNF